MSANLIFDLAPIGAIIAWSDGTPRPPERFNKKLAAWKTRNSRGRLVYKEGPRVSGNHASPGYFTLHEGDLGSKGTIVVTIYRTFALDSALSFKVVERPPLGTVRIFDRASSSRQLVHLADSHMAAKIWLESHGYADAVLENVTADEARADGTEERTAA